MLRYTACFAALTILLFIMIGCSGGGDPVTPGENSTVPVEEIDITINSDIAAGLSIPSIFGMYEVALDPANLTGDIYPLRQSGVLGDSFNVDITPFLAVSPCSDCIKIMSVALSVDGTVLVTFGTKHPFEPATRYDLHVFDMRGIIVVGDNPITFNNVKVDFDGNGTYETSARANVDLLVNPDGYTSFYDQVVEDYIGKIYDTNICPYKCMWENPATTTPDSNYNPGTAPFGFSDMANPTGHNVFPMGGDYDNPLSATTFEFDLSQTDSFNFLLILEASYGHTTKRFNRFEPRFFLPEFHRKDPWKVTAEFIQNDLISNNPASTALLELKVYDWQAGIEPSGGWEYNTSSLTEIKYASDVKDIILDLPFIIDNPITLDLNDLDSGDGSPFNPYTWQITLTNDQAASDGTYYGFLAVRDELEGTPNVPWGVSGDAQMPLLVYDITTYQAFKTVIEFSNVPPVADVDVAPNPVGACRDLTISVGPTCLDPDGTIVTYEYDFDYDGVTFAADVIQNAVDPDFGFDVITSFDETMLGMRDIAQRVTDDMATPVIDVVSLEVVANQAPTSELDDDDADNTVTICDEVTFQPGAGCIDPDGVITKYEYDYDYDGSSFVPDVTQNTGDPDFGDPVQHTFTNPGPGTIQYTVALQVTDDGCPDLTDIDTEIFDVTLFSGQLMYEDFESTAGGEVPSGWGIVGRTGGAYFLTSMSTGCTDPDWRWGVTDNVGFCEGGESRFLNESGDNHPASDPLETYQNRANIVYTPEFVVPPNGGVVTIRHNYQMLYGVLGAQTHYLDGGRVILSVDDPGASVTWDDFCNVSSSPSWDNSPLRPLGRTSGPVYNTISYFTAFSHPFSGMQAHSGDSGGWVTSTYSIQSTYGCETVRLGFLFASDDILMGYYNDTGPPEYYTDCSQYVVPPIPFGNPFPGFGWRINWMDISAN